MAEGFKITQRREAKVSFGENITPYVEIDAITPVTTRNSLSLLLYNKKLGNTIC